MKNGQHKLLLELNGNKKESIKIFYVDVFGIIRNKRIEYDF